MNDKQLKRLTEMQKAIDGGAVQPDELAEVVKTLLDIIKDLRTQLESKIKDNKNEVDSSIVDVSRSLNNIEKEVKTFAGDAKKSSFAAIEKISSRLSYELERIESMIPDMPDLTRIERQIEEVEKKIPILKETIPDKPEEIRDKLETLKKDERLDASAIKGLGKREERLSDSIVQRAVSIVDNRTSYLINAVSDLKETRIIGVNVHKITVSATAPANPSIYDLWYDIS